MTKCDHEWEKFDSLVYGWIWSCNKCYVVSTFTPKEVIESREEAEIDRYEQDKLFRGE